MAAARFGPRRAALAGVGLTAAASLAFALSDTAWALGAARLMQGVGSALSWAGALAWLVAAAPRERRGELIGVTMGAAVFGALLGPVLGAIATVAGVRVTFVGVSLLGVGLAVWVAVTPGVAAQPQSLSVLFRRADRRLLGGMWLLVLSRAFVRRARRARAAEAPCARLGRRCDRRGLPRHCRCRDRAQPVARPLHGPPGHPASSQGCPRRLDRRVIGLRLRRFRRRRSRARRRRGHRLRRFLHARDEVSLPMRPTAVGSPPPSRSER